MRPKSDQYKGLITLGDRRWAFPSFINRKTEAEVRKGAEGGVVNGRDLNSILGNCIRLLGLP